MRRSLLALTVILVATGLGCDKKASHNGRSGKLSKLDPSLENVTTKSLGESNGQRDILAEGGTSAKFQLADARALGKAYGRVFGNTLPRGDAPQDRYFKDNPSKFFSPGAERTLGTFNLLTVRLEQQRGERLNDLSQDYVRALREFLGEACLNLAGRELGKLTGESGDGAENNRLVTSLDAPSRADVNRFMALMFGLDVVPGTQQKGAAEYAKVFKNNMTKFVTGNAELAALGAEELHSDARYQSFLKENYQLLCIAVGTDQRVYLK